MPALRDAIAQARPIARASARFAFRLPASAALREALAQARGKRPMRSIAATASSRNASPRPGFWLL